MQSASASVRVRVCVCTWLQTDCNPQRQWHHSSYNAVNGVPACSNPTFLINTLRDMWGFDGFVISGT